MDGCLGARRWRKGGGGRAVGYIAIQMVGRQTRGFFCLLGPKRGKLISAGVIFPTTSAPAPPFLNLLKIDEGL